jgi:hypothetical protein
MKSLESYETESDSCINNYIDNDKKFMKVEKAPALSLSHISDHNINRCWLFFSDVILCQEISNNIVINYKFDKGDSTFKLGNEFSCYLIGISNIHYKCMESKNNYDMKKISWIIFFDIGFSIRKTYLIYPITSINKTLVKLKLELITSDSPKPVHFEETSDYFCKLQSSIIDKIVNLMEHSSKFLFIQESFIANLSREKCWEVMTNFNKLSEINMGKIGQNFEVKGDKEKIGTFWKCYLPNIKRNVYFKVKSIKKSKKRNKWIYCLETFGAEMYTLRQELEISITKINQNTCQISILIKFNEYVDKNYLNYKKQKLIEFIKRIKISLNKIRN